MEGRKQDLSDRTYMGDDMTLIGQYELIPMLDVGKFCTMFLSTSCFFTTFSVVNCNRGSNVLIMSGGRDIRNLCPNWRSASPPRSLCNL